MKSKIFLFATVALLFSLRMAMGQEKLGKVDFPVSCSPEAQAQFNRAVAMLHSFWFPQAPKAFAAVSEIDTDCAMAHWGIAISQRANPLVGPADAAAFGGVGVIEKARRSAPRLKEGTTSTPSSFWGTLSKQVTARAW
jgi:hypothetical protein